MDQNNIEYSVSNNTEGKHMYTDIEIVLKRDGTEESFDAEKINGWAEWAFQGSRASWSEVVTGALKKLVGPRVTSEEIQTALITAASDLIPYDVTYDVPAKELFLARLRKQVFDSYVPPSLKFWHDYLVSVGAWD